MFNHSFIFKELFLFKLILMYKIYDEYFLKMDENL